MSVIKIPEILLPSDEIDKSKWSVIACDQFTSQPEYWSALDNYCGCVSALRIIYPEIYIGKGEDERIKKINDTMKAYLDGGVFKTVKGLILSVRKTAFGHRRVGLIAAIDLENYSVKEKLAIRPTEAIVEERLPVRIKIRENASIELPHALLLIDDAEKTVIEPLYNRKGNLKKLYSFDLNMGGGSLEGYLVDDPQDVVKKLEVLGSKENALNKYGSEEPFLFAVGDGNHSIATAKACWETIKTKLSAKETKDHPARYCLAEINNIYDEDLIFEPIFRVVFGAGEDLINELKNSLSGQSVLKIVYKGKEYQVNVPENSALAIKNTQAVIDKYVSGRCGVTQDYIHGEENLLSVAKAKDGVAIFMPKLKKSDLFSYVAKNGVLTRKSFSMGEAQEKRYYYECRKIK